MVIGVTGFLWAMLRSTFYCSPKGRVVLSGTEREKIIGDWLRPANAERGKCPVKGVVTSRRFWAIVLTRSFAEPA